MGIFTGRGIKKGHHLYFPTQRMACMMCCGDIAIGIFHGRVPHGKRPGRSFHWRTQHPQNNLLGAIPSYATNIYDVATRLVTRSGAGISSNCLNSNFEASLEAASIRSLLDGISWPAIQIGQRIIFRFVTDNSALPETAAIATPYGLYMNKENSLCGAVRLGSRTQSQTVDVLQETPQWVSLSFLVTTNELY